MPTDHSAGGGLCRHPHGLYLESGSLGISLKNGKDLFIRITDQLGTDTLDAGKIVGALKKAGVREVDDVREVRSLGLEMVRLPE